MRAFEYFNTIKELDGNNTNQHYEELNVFVRFTQIHINRLKNQCNRLIFNKERAEYKISLTVACIIAVFSILLTLGVSMWQNCSSQKQKSSIKEIETTIDLLKIKNQEQIISDSIRFDSIQTSINELIEQNKITIQNINRKLKTVK
ncbi:MAG: hypothetical protein WCZ43_14215 [Proteiniphilum sp.]